MALLHPDKLQSLSSQLGPKPSPIPTGDRAPGSLIQNIAQKFFTQRPTKPVGPVTPQKITWGQPPGLNTSVQQNLAQQGLASPTPSQANRSSTPVHPPGHPRYSQAPITAAPRLPTTGVRHQPEQQPQAQPTESTSPLQIVDQLYNL